ncbi:MAG TPA: hypothetical protein H9741_03845, partial [Candidatus Borkfalkia faecipullorum]|nr:hypothetical protein [Candidatus Borkfalkia faecipullorum]
MKDTAVEVQDLKRACARPFSARFSLKDRRISAAFLSIAKGGGCYGKKIKKVFSFPNGGKYRARGGGQGTR